MSHLSSLDSQSHIVVYCPKGATSVPAFAPSLCRIETFRFLLRKESVNFPVLLFSSQYHETENNKTPTLYLIAGGYFNVFNYPNIDFFDLKLLSPINCQLPSCPDLRKTLTSHKCFRFQDDKRLRVIEMPPSGVTGQANIGDSDNFRRLSR